MRVIALGVLFFISHAAKCTPVITNTPIPFVTNRPMITARVDHTATLLSNSKVLVAGGNGALNAAELYDPGPGTWMATASLKISRNGGHSATMLPNGKVLITGGFQNDGVSVLASSELYEPSTGTWIPANELIAARAGHTATLLPNGKVLVAGGYAQSGTGFSLGTAELFDPATGAWTATGPLNTSRWQHTATLLPNGNVLVAGGFGASGYLLSAEVYDPATGVWTITGSLNAPRSYHTSTLLPNGKVLTAGGEDSNGMTGGAELYDPITGTWTLTTRLAAPRSLHTASLLPNGRLLVAGGYDRNLRVSVPTAEVYDPTQQTWTRIGVMNTARGVHTATVLHNGSVLLAGGYNSTNGALASNEVYYTNMATWAYMDRVAVLLGGHEAILLPSGAVLAAGGVNAELYDPANSTWTNTGSLSLPRFNYTLTLLRSGKVLAAGGYIGDSTAELYDPESGTWKFTGAMTTNRLYHSATLLPNGKVLIAGGQGANFFTFSSAELYDPDTETWTAIAPMTTNRALHTSALLPNGKVLVAAGFNGTYHASAELYDPDTGTWTLTGSLITARYEHASTSLADGRVMVMGGVNVFGFRRDLASAELYDPTTGTWSAAGSMKYTRLNPTATRLPNGRVLIAGGFTINGSFNETAEMFDPASGTWTASPSMNFDHYVHRATLLPNGKVLISDYRLELYDVGLGSSNYWVPQITSWPSQLDLGSPLTITGFGFRGISEGSIGNSRDSAADYPVVQLRNLENGRTVFLEASSWSATSFHSTPVSGLPIGYVMATVFVNGIPSISSILNITPSNAPPIALCRDLIKPSDANCQAAVTSAEVDNGSSDPDNDPLTFSLTPAGPYPLGTNSVTFSVADNHGHTTTCEANITVVDLRPPTISCSVKQSVLWPPNHKFVDVGFTATAADNCNTSPLPITIQVFSNEQDQPSSHDHSAPDAIDIALGILKLRQERKGHPVGRVYLIVVTSTDSSGNIGSGSCTVVVPANGSGESFAAASAEAARAQGYSSSHSGAAPPGYFFLGETP